MDTDINFRESHRLLFNPRLEKVASLLSKPLVRWADKKYLHRKRRPQPS